MIFQRHKNNVFNMFFATYILVIVFFLCMFFAVSQVVIHSVNRYDRSTLSKTAEHSNEMLLQQLENVRNICAQIKSGNNNSFDLFLDVDKQKADHLSYSDKQKIYEETRDYAILNPTIDEIYLFRRDSDVICSSMGIVDLNIMYGGLVQFDDMTLKEFRESYLNGYKYDFFSRAIRLRKSGELGESQTILYIASYEPAYASGPTGYIVISIKLDALLGTIGYLPDNDQQAVLYNSKHEQLWSSFTPDLMKAQNDTICEIDGKKYMTFYSQNNEGLNFMTAKLYNAAVRETIRFRLVSIFVMLFAAAIGILLSVYFAKVNAKPIKNITARLKGVNGTDGGAGNEFLYISNSIDKIIHDMSSIQKDFEKERAVLVNDFVNSLLLGDIWKSTDIAAAAKRLELDIDAKRFAVMIVEIVDEQHLNSTEKMRSIQKSVCQEYKCRFKCMTCLYGMNTIVTIFEFEDRDDSKNILDVENVTYTIGETLFSSLGMYIKCAMGVFYDVLEDISYSYESAKENISEGICTEYRHVAWYVRADDAVSWYYYPDEVRHGLENAFRNHDLEKINHILDLVLNENQSCRTLSETVLSLLYTNMEMTMYDLIKQYCTDISDRQMLEMVGKIEQDRGMEVFFKSIREAYRELLQSYSVGDLKQQILDYMAEAALKTDFDRQTFADHFFISPDYVSKFFKENTGYGFVKYSAKVKLDKACEMLMENNYSIEQIASAVGYNSALSFRRAFKNYTGLSPSEYRHQNIK